MVLMAIFGLEHRKRNMKNIPWTYGNVRWFGGRGPSTDSSDATWICFLIFLQINFPMVNHHLREYMLGLAYILRTKWVNKLFVLMKGSRFLAFIICWFIIVLGMAQLLCVYPRNQVGRMCKPPGILMLKKISFALFYPFFLSDKNLMLLGSTQFFWGKIFQAWKKWCWGRGVKTYESMDVK